MVEHLPNVLEALGSVLSTKGQPAWWCAHATSALRTESNKMSGGFPPSSIVQLPVVEIKVKIHIFIYVAHVLEPGSEEYIKYF